MKKSRFAHGFTLIEILVVLFIISIVTSVALLTISRNDNRQLESITKELVQALTLAEEKAMLQPSVLGLTIEKNAYQFSSYQPAEGKNKANWLLADANHLIPHNVELSVDVEGKKISADQDDETKSMPQIVISTNGDITPFTIYIGKKGNSPHYEIRGDSNGNITSRSLS